MINSVFFKRPPACWEHSMPLGNGRLGAMVRGDPCSEILQLNEEFIWSGGPQDRINPDAAARLSEIRTLVKDGYVAKAQELGFEALSGAGFNERVYQTAGEFRIDFFPAAGYGVQNSLPVHQTPQSYLKDYRAELDLQNAVCSVTYSDDDGVTFIRRTWISAEDDMLFMQVTASKKGSVNFRGYLDRGIWCDAVYSEDGFIFLEDSHGIPFCVGAGVVTEGGSFSTVGACVTASGCDSALFFIDIQTLRWGGGTPSRTEYDRLVCDNFWKKKCHDRLCETRQRLLEQTENASSILIRHSRKFRSYYDRLELKLSSVKETAASSAELLERAEDNPELIVQYGNFSRYLLISSSMRPGVLPATLQGLWNCYMDPPWGSKYTVNINLQMNYWPSLMCSLPELHLPLIALLERAYENGRLVARRMYNCSGYVIHHNLDCWGDAAPQDNWLPGTYWVLGAAWLATHIWEHYEYTLDRTVLKDYYYLIHEACLFFVDFLTPSALISPDGKPYLIVNPSVSPENSYVTRAGETGSFCAGCEMDNMILEHLFSSCLKAALVLNESATDKGGRPYPAEEFESFRYVLAHIKSPCLNKDGTLMEWNEEVQETDPGHRHISHLYGLFPGHTILPERNRSLAEAARRTLQKRLANGGGHTGWSQAWIINFWAALGDGDAAYSGLETLFSHSTLPNLLDNHPPFQIDGNFGALAGIIRLLVQSEFSAEDEVTVRLLPALPSKKMWQSGSLRGVRVRGNFLVDFSWENGRVTSVKSYHPDGEESSGKPEMKLKILYD